MGQQVPAHLRSAPSCLASRQTTVTLSTSVHGPPAALLLASRHSDPLLASRHSDPFERPPALRAARPQCCDNVLSTALLASCHSDPLAPSPHHSDPFNPACLASRHSDPLRHGSLWYVRAAHRDLFIKYKIGGSRQGRTKVNNPAIVDDLLAQLAAAGMPMALRETDDDKYCRN